MGELSRDPEAIRAGIERARQDIEQSVSDLRANVSQGLNWRSFVRRHPGAWFHGRAGGRALVARTISR